MSTLINSVFTKYEQTRQEQLTGSVLTTTQKEFIQTHMAMLAEERLALVPDANNYAAFVQTEAHLKGQISSLQYLIDCSAESESELLTLAQAQAATS